MKFSVFTGGGVAFACLLSLAGGLAPPNAARAAAVDLTFDFDKDAMSTGTCAGIICPESLGTVTITGDTTSSLTYTVSLASGVSFQHPAGSAGASSDILYFELTGGSPDFSDGITPTGGTNFTYGGPTSGTFHPNPGNFPGPYDYAVTCTQSKPATLCGTGTDPATTTFSFTVTGGSVADPFVIGSPIPPGGDFKGIPIAFVADLSIAGTGTTPGGLCPGTDACTGLVGTNAVTTPEPSTWAMMLIGFAGLAYAGYRKTKRAALSVA
jgi:PEP-CTERM motif